MNRSKAPRSRGKSMPAVCWSSRERPKGRRCYQTAMPADGLIAAHSILGETSARSLSPVKGQLPKFKPFHAHEKGICTPVRAARRRRGIADLLAPRVRIAGSTINLCEQFSADAVYGRRLRVGCRSFRRREVPHAKPNRYRRGVQSCNHPRDR